MSKVLKIIFTILIVNSLFSSEYIFDIQLGVNYFNKTDKNEYKIYNNNEDAYGKILYDDDGFSFYIGSAIKISDRSSLLINYRTPRKCSYEYQVTSTPYVWGPNTQLIKTETSSLVFETKYYLKEVLKVLPYWGLGINICNVKAYNRRAFKNPNTGEYIYYTPVDDYWYAGSKYFLGTLINLGLSKAITNRISINFDINYTFLRIDNWSNENPRAKDQNISGLYFNLKFNMNLKNERN